MRPHALIWSSQSWSTSTTSTPSRRPLERFRSSIWQVQKSPQRQAPPRKVKTKPTLSTWVFQLSVTLYPPWARVATLLFHTVTTCWPSWWRTLSVEPRKLLCSSIALLLCTMSPKPKTHSTTRLVSRKSKTTWPKTLRPKKPSASKVSCRCLSSKWALSQTSWPLQTKWKSTIASSSSSREKLTRSDLASEVKM